MRSRLIAAPLPVVVAIVAAAVLWLVMPLSPMDEDAWYFFAIGRWFGEHASSSTAWAGLFTEYFNHREPIFRPLNNLWFAGMWAVFGQAWWGWLLVSMLLHGLAGVLVVQVGRGMGLSERAAMTAGLLWLLHPVQAELLAWALGQETQVMTLLLLAAVRLHQTGRIGQAAAMSLAAMLAKEQGLTVAGAIVLADLAVGQRRWQRWVPVAACAAAMLAWRALVLAEPGNAAHAEFTAQYLAVPLMDRLHGLFVVATGVFAAPPAGVWGWAILAGILAAAIGGGARDARAAGLWWLVAALWLWGIILPASADLEIPLETRPGQAPSWNLRHLYPALVGPFWALGWSLDRLGRRAGWFAAVLGGLMGIGLVTNVLPFADAGNRATAAIAAIEARPWQPNDGVRVIEPLDPVAAALLYRPLAVPDARTAPLLIGEPRCGCAQPLPNTDFSDLPTLRALTERVFALHIDIEGIAEVGADCLCPRWRADAMWWSFDGEKFGPDGY